MLSNSSKYAINAVIYLALHASPTKRLAPKDIAEALHIPTSFLAKILQTLARKKVISSNKGPGGGFWITDEEKEWLNNYHKEVYNRLQGYLTDDEKRWLERQTAPIG